MARAKKGLFGVTLAGNATEFDKELLDTGTVTVELETESAPAEQQVTEQPAAEAAPAGSAPADSAPAGWTVAETSVEETPGTATATATPQPTEDQQGYDAAVVTEDPVVTANPEADEPSEALLELRLPKGTRETPQYLITPPMGKGRNARERWFEKARMRWWQKGDDGLYVVRLPARAVKDRKLTDMATEVAA